MSIFATRCRGSGLVGTKKHLFSVEMISRILITASGFSKYESCSPSKFALMRGNVFSDTWKYDKVLDGRFWSFLNEQCWGVNGALWPLKWLRWRCSITSDDEPTVVSVVFGTLVEVMRLRVRWDMSTYVVNPRNSKSSHRRSHTGIILNIGKSSSAIFRDLSCR